MSILDFGAEKLKKVSYLDDGKNYRGPEKVFQLDIQWMEAPAAGDVQRGAWSPYDVDPACRWIHDWNLAVARDEIRIWSKQICPVISMNVKEVPNKVTAGEIKLDHIAYLRLNPAGHIITVDSTALKDSPTEDLVVSSFEIVERGELSNKLRTCHITGDDKDEIARLVLAALELPVDEIFNGFDWDGDEDRMIRPSAGVDR